MAPQGRIATGPGPRFPAFRCATSLSLRHLRLGAQPGSRCGGYRPCHRTVRRCLDSRVVASGRSPFVSTGPATSDHRRWRGSNGYRARLWKLELQRLADELRFAISVCHFPPGTSKWNKVEHRLFSFISTNWRGEPGNRLPVSCRLDRRKYAVGRRISDEEMKQVKIRKEKFHVEWNYTILPTLP